jgi:hypothetical protein
MGAKRHGRDQTDLDWALEYVWDKITNTVSRRSFGDLVRTASVNCSYWRLNGSSLYLHGELTMK